MTDLRLLPSSFSGDLKMKCEPCPEPSRGAERPTPAERRRAQREALRSKGELVSERRRRLGQRVPKATGLTARIYSAPTCRPAIPAPSPSTARSSTKPSAPARVDPERRAAEGARVWGFACDCGAEHRSQLRGHEEPPTQRVEVNPHPNRHRKSKREFWTPGSPRDNIRSGLTLSAHSPSILSGTTYR